MYRENEVVVVDFSGLNPKKNPPDERGSPTTKGRDGRREIIIEIGSEIEQMKQKELEKIQMKITDNNAIFRADVAKSMRARMSRISATQDGRKEAMRRRPRGWDRFGSAGKKHRCVAKTWIKERNRSVRGGNDVHVVWVDGAFNNVFMTYEEILVNRLYASHGSVRWKGSFLHDRRRR